MCSPPWSSRPSALPLLALLVVLVPALVSAARPTLATAAPPVVVPPLPTANSLHPDLLPSDCGLRPLPPPAGHQQQFAGLPTENPAYAGQFPWHVRLREPGGQHLCSGLIITERHVLTAADCVLNTLPSQVFVRVADVHISAIDEGERDIAVTDIHVHHPRNGSKLVDNVALLRLDSPLQFSSHVQPACLPVAGAGHATFLQCEIAGWGRHNSSEPVPDALRSDAVPLASDQYCASPEVYGDRFVHNRTVCSGPNRHGPLHSCRGDAGGGLTCLDESAGRVMAFGLLAAGDKQGCGRRPGIYAKISGFVDWILCHVRFDQEGGTGARPPLCGMQASIHGPPTGAAQPIPLNAQLDHARGVPDQPDHARGAPSQPDHARGEPDQPDHARVFPGQPDHPRVATGLSDHARGVAGRRGQEISDNPRIWGRIWDRLLSNQLG